VKDLRDFITVIEHAWTAEDPLVESTLDTEGSTPVTELLSDLVFKLRAHSEPLNESQEGGYSLGVEAGCEMAAEMIENLIRQLSGDAE
jgi:hypothetical protein